MERILARLERRYGAYAVPNLTALVVTGMAVVYLAIRLRPSTGELLTLDFEAVAHGQVWRLVSYLFLPRTLSPWGILFSLAFVWYVGSTLEAHWGSFRFNLFYLLGCAGTTLAAWLTGTAETNSWINYSLMLAFGTLFPDEEINFYLVLPIKAKWYAVCDALFLAYSAATGGLAVQAAILASLSGYFVFCSPALLALFRGRKLAVRQAARRAAVAPAEPAVSGTRVCAICGASEADGADIRVCSCEKCGGGPRNLCLAHARSH